MASLGAKNALIFSWQTFESQLLWKTSVISGIIDSRGCQSKKFRFRAKSFPANNFSFRNVQQYYGYHHVSPDINLDLETFGKKKKKKKVPLNLDDLGDALPSSEPKPAPTEEVREQTDALTFIVLLGGLAIHNSLRMITGFVILKIFCWGPIVTVLNDQ